MNRWADEKILFWRSLDKLENKIYIQFLEDEDYVYNYPEGFEVWQTDIINAFESSKTTYIQVNRTRNDDGYFVNLRVGKHRLDAIFYDDSQILDLKKLSFSDNIDKGYFVTKGLQIKHKGIRFTTRWQEQYDLYEEIEDIYDDLKEAQEEKDDSNISETHRSKIENTIETLEYYIEKEKEQEDIKIGQQKPFIGTQIKPFAQKSNFKYYYQVSLVESSIKELQELNPRYLSAHINQKEFKFEVYDIGSKGALNIILSTTEQIDAANLEGSLELRLTPNDISHKTRKEVTQQLRENSCRNEWLAPLAADVYKFGELKKQKVPEYNEQFPRLKAQEDAVFKGAGTKDLSLVLGPPGTGKTTVILSWVKFFAQKGLKTLVASQSNKAVDNVLERLKEEKDLEILRVGNDSKVSQEVQGLLIENYALTAQKNIISKLQDLNQITQKTQTSLKDFANFLETNLKNNELIFQIEFKTNTKKLQQIHKNLLELKQERKTIKEKNSFLNRLFLAIDLFKQTNKDRKKIAILEQKNENLKEKTKKLKQKLEQVTVKIEQKIKEINSLRSMLEKKHFLKPLFILSSIERMLDLKQENKELRCLKKEHKKLKNKINKINELRLTNKNTLDTISKQITKLAKNQGLTRDFVENEARHYEHEFINTFWANFFDCFRINTAKNKKSSCQKRINKNNKKINNLKKQQLKIIKSLKTISNKLKEIKNSTPLPKDLGFIEHDFYALKNITQKPYKEIKRQIKKDCIFYIKLNKIIKNWHDEVSKQRQSSLFGIILEYVDVVGATCIGINSNKLFKEIPFDVVIIDESGQIQLHNLIVPLSRAPKAILVGDHKQLPPVVDDEIKKDLISQGENVDLFEKSWFEVLWDKLKDNNKTILDTQFRCPSIISDFISEQFYDSKYKAGDVMKLKKPLLDYPCTMVFIDTSLEKNNEEKIKKNEERQEITGNPLETRLILAVFKRLTKALPDLLIKGEIGVIVPYKNHVQEVKKEFKKQKIDIKELNINDMIASVDSYQGQEKNVIIFAFSRSNKYGNIGFLKDWRRLNVAMTRTKQQLIMIGNLKTLTKQNKKNDEKKFKTAIKELEKLLREKGAVINARDILEQNAAPKNAIHKNATLKNAISKNTTPKNTQSKNATPKNAVSKNTPNQQAQPKDSHAKA